MLGIRPAYDGLVIDPCIPKEWPGFEVERAWRGAIYWIAVKNPARVEKGVKSVLLNGKPITGLIPPQKAGSTNEVVVTMG